MSQPNTLGEFSLNSTPTPASDLEAERLTRKREAALGYRIMASWGWGADGSGHITARDPENKNCFWLLGYGVPFAKATIDDLVLIDEAGALIEGNRAANPAAFHIHAPIHAARGDGKEGRIPFINGPSVGPGQCERGPRPR